MASHNLQVSSSHSSEPDLDPNTISLDQLVDVFLASKRSLTCINQVWRARDITDTARQSVEENAVVSARNAFVKYAVGVQVEWLEAIRLGGSLIGSATQNEYDSLIKELDEASARLDNTLKLLQSTTVDAAFHGQGEEAIKCLQDFIDEAGVKDLYDGIKVGIDRFTGSQKSFTESRRSFHDILQSVASALETDDANLSKSQDYQMDGISPVPHIFDTLENHATEVASHLQGLVKHYDLCVSALQNTEGGGDFISKLSQNEPDGEGQESRFAGFGLGITKLDETGPEITSAEDRISMLTVIIKDAQEVEEVVHEIKENLSEMEDLLSRIQSYMSNLHTISEGIGAAHVILKDIMSQIPEYMSDCAIFQQSWEDEKNILIEKVNQMDVLNEFYEGYADGYDNMILEVQRRRKARREMEKLVSNTMEKIDKLYKVELDRREEFTREHGEFLPNDIWPGLTNEPIRYDVLTTGDETNQLPELTKNVVEQAIKRIAKRSEMN